ncbi:hypothetical protein AGMMS49525_09680 [Bacteroidia bacterium]|nr:hypothetical protein AGMMS49525_09680 [Bacteroidia bacterium]
MNNLKILHIRSGRGAKGGTANVFLSLQRLFGDLKIESDVVVRSGAAIVDKLPVGTNITKINYSRQLPTWMQIAAKRKMATAAQNHNLLILHKPADAKIWRAAFPDAKIVLFIHDFGWVKNLQFADLLVAVSHSVAQNLHNFGWKNVMVMENFLTTEISNHKIDANKKIIFSAFGIFRKTKGFAELIRAAAILEKMSTLPDYQINLYGAGRQKLYYHLLKRFFNTRHLNICNWTANVPDVMQKSDVVVVPSRHETFGIVLIEAMASGALVLATRSGGPESILQHEVDGILVPTNNPVALATAMQNIIEHPNNYLEMRENGRRKVAERYTETTAKKNLQNIFTCFE